MILQVEGVSKNFGGIQALNKVKLWSDKKKNVALANRKMLGIESPNLKPADCPQ